MNVLLKHFENGTWGFYTTSTSTFCMAFFVGRICISGGMREEISRYTRQGELIFSVNRWQSPEVITGEFPFKLRNNRENSIYEPSAEYTLVSYHASEMDHERVHVFPTENACKFT